MILQPSYLHNGIPYTGKTTSLYWIEAQVTYLIPESLPQTNMAYLGTWHQPDIETTPTAHDRPT